MQGVRDHFERICGSPDGYPMKGASPYDEFTCNHCGESQSIQIYGNFPIGIEPETEATRILQSHLSVCREFQKWLRKSA